MLFPLKNRPLRLILLVSVTAACCVALTLYSLKRVRHTTSDALSLNQLREAYMVILENYVEQPDSKKLVL